MGFYCLATAGLPYNTVAALDTRVVTSELGYFIASSLSGFRFKLHPSNGVNLLFFYSALLLFCAEKATIWPKTTRLLPCFAGTGISMSQSFFRFR